MWKQDSQDMIQPHTFFSNMCKVSEKISSNLFNFNMKGIMPNSYLFGLQCAMGICYHSWYYPTIVFCWCDWSKSKGHWSLGIPQHKSNGSYS
jgi:hypothetical protein